VSLSPPRILSSLPVTIVNLSRLKVLSKEAGTQLALSTSELDLVQLAQAEEEPQQVESAG
jgi:hypothetical protein